MIFIELQSPLKYLVTEDMPEESRTDVKRYSQIVAHMENTFLRKNHDYGNSFHTTWKEFGDKGIVTGVARISDKYHRLLNLSLGTEPFVDESIDDTLMDMANYCIMTLMELEKDRSKNSDKTEKE
jgi:hypothetical protein